VGVLLRFSSGFWFFLWRRTSSCSTAYPIVDALAFSLLFPLIALHRQGWRSQLERVQESVTLGSCPIRLFGEFDEEWRCKTSLSACSTSSFCELSQNVVLLWNSIIKRQTLDVVHAPLFLELFRLVEFERTNSGPFFEGRRVIHPPPRIPFPQSS